MPMRNLEVRINGDSSGLQRSLENAENSIRSFENAAENSEEQVGRSGESAAVAFAEARRQTAALTDDIVRQAAVTAEAIANSAESAGALDFSAASALPETLSEMRISADEAGDTAEEAFRRTSAEAENAEESVEGLNDALDETSAEAENAGNSINRIAGAAVGIVALKKSVEALFGAFREYIEYESAVIRVSDIFKENSDAITEFAENQAALLGMSESSAYKYAAVYGNLFRNITADTKENSKVTVSMLQASATVASRTGRTMQDVMERMRSGLLGNTEAIEDLGIFVNVAMLETTDAFKKIADGRSWEQLTFYEQQQIRTLGILEQVSRQFGSGIVQNTAMSVSSLSAAFDDLKVSAGTLASEAFTPVIHVLTSVVKGIRSVVEWFGSLNSTSKTYLGIAAALAIGIPAVTLATKGLALAQAGLHAIQAVLIPQTLTFGAVLKSALGWISLIALALGVLYAIFGGSNTESQSEEINNYSDALKNTQSNALKTAKSIDNVTDSTHALANELKHSLAGFDELNIINSDGSTANQGILGFDSTGIDETAAALGVFDDLAYTIEFDSDAKSFSDKTKGFFAGMWKNIKKGFKDWSSWWEGAGEDMYEGIHSGNWEPLLTRLNGVVKKIFGEEWSSFWEKAGENMYIGIEEGDWEPLLTQLDSWMRNKFGNEWSDFWTSRGEKMYDAFHKAKEDIGPVLGAIYAGAELIFGENWTKFWEEVGGDIYDIFFGNAEESYNALSDLNSKIRSLFGKKWTDFWEGVGEAIYDAFHGKTDDEINDKLKTNATSALSNTASKMIAFETIKSEYENKNKSNSVIYPEPFTGFDYSYPRLPGYATGGIITRPTVAQIGESGAEAVIPLERNMEWIDRVAERLKGSASQSDGVFHLHVELDGREVGRASFKYSELEKARRGG